ncbi:MAG: hypothetical protein ABNH53_01290 [Henriciella sp.]|jgi:hypothetical protein
MSKSMKLGRRAFLVGQACVVGATAAGTAQAGTSADRNLTWERAAKPQFKHMIGDKFEAQTASGAKVELQLRLVEASRSGWKRPLHLARSEGVSLVFDSPEMDAIAAEGSQNIQVKHAKLGAFEAYVDVMPRRRGGHELEMILN